MEESLAWAVIGLTLIIVELLTGTFYLLMLGGAAFGAALVAWFGQPFPVQAIVAGVVSALGAYMVHAYRVRNHAQQMPSIDQGQPASFESWIDATTRLARVRYRGASWDAQVSEPGALEPGAMLYVVNADGNTLTVSRARPG